MNSYVTREKGGGGGIYPILLRLFVNLLFKVTIGVTHGGGGAGGVEASHFLLLGNY